MKIERAEIYVAFDGTRFTVKEECVAYERDHATDVLVGLKKAQIVSAIEEGGELADAIERVGYLIGLARRKRGDFKKRMTKAQPGSAPL